MENTLDNPWQTTGSRVVYDNPWISVREDAVIRPDGNPGIYGVVHLKSKAIGILACDQEGRIHLVGQYRYTLGIYSWEIPEGGSLEGEEPLEAAKRELLEETGLTASHWKLFARSHLSNCVTDEEALLYLATGLQQGTACPEATEKLEHKCVGYQDALEMVKNGEITDSMTMIAILRFALLRKEAETHNFWVN
jgi:8-oxo-dGTP pyrophosphatase MutT (NUDIX family)